MNYKNIIAVVAMMGFAVQSQAQTDVTNQYLTNAGLTSLSGWSYGDNGYNYTDWKTDGDVPVIEFYNEWSTNAGAAIGNTRNFHFTQTVTLPAGNYRLAVNAFYREGNGTGQNTKAYIFAGDKTQYITGLSANGLNGYTGANDLYKAANAFSKGDFSNEFDFSLTTTEQITIGFRGYIDTYCSWCILGPVTLYRYTADDYLLEDRKQLVNALERFENDYNLADGTDYGRKTMSAEAWTSLLAKVKAASLAIDDQSQASSYAELRDGLVAQMDATDASLRLFKSYQSMSAGVHSLTGGSAANDEMNTDAAEQAAIVALNTAFANYVNDQNKDFSMAAFLGENLDFNTAQGSALVNMDNMSIHDIVGWEEDFANLDGWSFIENSNASFQNQLYLRCNWTDRPVKLQVSKSAMLPVGMYRLSMQWNSNLQNMTNLSCYQLGDAAVTIGKAVTSAQTLNYEISVANEPAPFDLVLGLVKKNGGNAPAQIVVDNIVLNCNVAGTNPVTEVCSYGQDCSDDDIFDLKGRRVDAATLKPGIYVMRGKKFVVKKTGF